MAIKKLMELDGVNIEISDAVINTITPEAATDLKLQGVTGKDVVLAFTDNAGARGLLIVDSDAATVCKIDSNGLVTTATGLAGPVTGTLTGDVTKGSTDLTITAASAKDIIVKLGDAEAAKKLYVKDSANAEQASIDSDGVLTAKKVVAPLPTAATDTDGAPTSAEMVSAFGAAAIGKQGIYVDTHAVTGVAYICFASASTWYAVAGVAGA